MSASPLRVFEPVGEPVTETTVPRPDVKTTQALLYDPTAPASPPPAQGTFRRRKLHTVADVIDWMTAHGPRGKSGPAVSEKRRIWQRFKAELGDVPVEDLTGHDLVDFVARHGPDFAANTVARWYRSIKHPFNHAERLLLVSRSPFRGVQIPKGAQGRDLTEAEVRKLLRAAAPTYRRMIFFLILTGLRPGELRGLTWDMLSQEAGGLVIREHKTAAATGKPRTFPFTALLIRFLVWLKRRSKSAYIFTNTRGGPLLNSTVGKYFRELRKRTGLAVDAKLYGCRHYFGTRLLMKTGDLATVAELMGHTNTQTTRRYVHLAGKSDHLRAAAEKASLGSAPRKQPDASPAAGSDPWAWLKEE